MELQKNFVERLLAGFFSERTYNTMAYYVFSFGYWTQMYAIERPVRQQLGNLGHVILLQYRQSPYRRYVRGLGVFSLILYFSFEILQMVRFVPTDGFTLRVVYVMYYFVLTLLGSIFTYVNFENELLLVYAWDRIEANTKMCQRYGVLQAARWKFTPIALLIIVPVIMCTTVVGFGMVLLFAFKPNLPAHIFYLLPEQWKPYKTAYLAACIWQIFVILNAVTAISYLAIIAVAFIFGTKVVAVETASSNMSIPNKMRMFRAVEIVNQLANEYASNLFLPVLAFFTVATGVTFTYIGLTRYGDPHLGLPVYCAVVLIDSLVLMAVTLAFIQIGKYADASAELIESIRMALKEPESLEDQARLPYLRKKLKALRPFGLTVGSYAKVNVETTKLLHETIVDYLILMLSY